MHCNLKITNRICFSPLVKFRIEWGKTRMELYAPFVSVFSYNAPLALPFLLNTYQHGYLKLTLQAAVLIASISRMPWRLWQHIECLNHLASENKKTTNKQTSDMKERKKTKETSFQATLFGALNDYIHLNWTVWTNLRFIFTDNHALLLSSFFLPRCYRSTSKIEMLPEISAGIIWFRHERNILKSRK